MIRAVTILAVNGLTITAGAASAANIWEPAAATL